MKVLVVGGGGREHALAWKLSQSPLLKELFCVPGNAGTEQDATNVDIGAEDTDRLVKFAQEEQIDLTVVGAVVVGAGVGVGLGVALEDRNMSLTVYP